MTIHCAICSQILQTVLTAEHTVFIVHCHNNFPNSGRENAVKFVSFCFICVWCELARAG